MKLKLLLALTTIGTSVFSQTAKPRTSGVNIIRFGMHIGANATFSRVTQSPSHSFESISLSSGVGPSVGVDVLLKMNQRLSVKASLPTLILSERTLRYQMLNTANVVQHQIESLYGPVSLALEYSLPRMHNHQWYLSSGVMYAKDLASHKGRNGNIPLPPIRLKPYNYFLSGGIGLKLYRKYATISPEIAFYHGLPNVISSHNSSYTNAISDFRSHILAFTLRFS